MHKLCLSQTAVDNTDENLFSRYIPPRLSGTAGDTIFLDSAATALKPEVMTQATARYYQHDSGATVHRSHHRQARAVTEQFEQARDAVRQLIQAEDARSCIWTKGTTESLNLVAQGFFRPRLQPGMKSLSVRWNTIPT